MISFCFRQCEIREKTESNWRPLFSFRRISVAFLCRQFPLWSSSLWFYLTYSVLLLQLFPLSLFHLYNWLSEEVLQRETSLNTVNIKTVLPLSILV